MQKVIKSIALFVAILGLVAAFGSSYHASPVKAAGNGAIWTTTGSCGTPQNVNSYEVGDTVFINGSGFDAGDYAWQIKGQPGNASADPNIVVASDTVTVDGTGSFCFEAYVVANDDDGEYGVKVGNKGDNYNVDGITPMLGCTDPDADNFDSLATQDDGSCTYPPAPVLGCTDPEANNFDANATEDDGSCTYDVPPVLGCTDPEANNFDPEATQNDESCTYDVPPVPGCTDPEANNFDEAATVDDQSCAYDVPPVPGCMDPEANNFNESATVDDESCTYDEENPTDDDTPTDVCLNLPEVQETTPEGMVNNDGVCTVVTVDLPDDEPTTECSDGIDNDGDDDIDYPDDSGCSSPDDDREQRSSGGGGGSSNNNDDEGEVLGESTGPGEVLGVALAATGTDETSSVVLGLGVIALLAFLRKARQSLA